MSSGLRSVLAILVLDASAVAASPPPELSVTVYGAYSRFPVRGVNQYLDRYRDLLAASEASGEVGRINGGIETAMELQYRDAPQLSFFGRISYLHPSARNHVRLSNGNLLSLEKVTTRLVELSVGLRLWVGPVPGLFVGGSFGMGFGRVATNDLRLPREWTTTGSTAGGHVGFLLPLGDWFHAVAEAGYRDRTLGRPTGDYIPPRNSRWTIRSAPLDSSGAYGQLGIGVRL